MVLGLGGGKWSRRGEPEPGQGDGYKAAQADLRAASEAAGYQGRVVVVASAARAGRRRRTGSGLLGACAPAGGGAVCGLIGAVTKGNAGSPPLQSPEGLACPGAAAASMPPPRQSSAPQQQGAFRTSSPVGRREAPALKPPSQGEDLEIEVPEGAPPGTEVGVQVSTGEVFSVVLPSGCKAGMILGVCYDPKLKTVSLTGTAVGI